MVTTDDWTWTGKMFQMMEAARKRATITRPVVQQLLLPGSVRTHFRCGGTYYTKSVNNFFTVTAA